MIDIGETNSPVEGSKVKVTTCPSAAAVERRWRSSAAAAAATARVKSFSVGYLPLYLAGVSRPCTDRYTVNSDRSAAICY